MLGVLFQAHHRVGHDRLRDALDLHMATLLATNLIDHMR